MYALFIFFNKTLFESRIAQDILALSYATALHVTFQDEECGASHTLA